MRTYSACATIILNWWKRILGGVVIAFVMTSATPAAESPSIVNLGTSGNFVLLAKTGISVTGTTAIVGNIGVSPAAATSITGFGLIADPSGVFSTSSLVTGKIFAADYTSPTPTGMTSAISDMETAYTDAAGRSLPDFTELYAGDVTGKTLVPGVYKWDTPVVVSSGGVTFAGSANDIWILQIAKNLELANGAAVTLTGGAQASNIFWQVAGQVTLGTMAAMKGVILCKTAIVFGTGAALDGRALAQTAITLDANTITLPSEPVSAGNGGIRQKLSSVQTGRDHSLEFAAPSSGTAIVRIMNIRGQKVRTLFDGEVQAGQKNSVQLDAGGMARGYYLSFLELNGTVISSGLVHVE